MPIIIVIDKSGNAKQQKILDTNVDNLYKKAGLKSADGFKFQTEWKVEFENKKYCVKLYAKKDGKAGQENKFDMPPPVDSTLFFGNMVLVNMENGQMRDLLLDQWNQIYEYLFGGFEDLGEDDDDEDEMDTDDEIEQMESAISARKGEQVAIKRTKQGYAKDGFIVDDDEDEEDQESDEATDYTETDMSEQEEDSDKESEAQIAPLKETTKKRSSERLAKKKVVYEEPEEEQASYLDCTSELEEEEYV
jgi:hypothetical protein